MQAYRLCCQTAVFSVIIIISKGYIQYMEVLRVQYSHAHARTHARTRTHAHTHTHIYSPKWSFCRPIKHIYYPSYILDILTTSI